MKDSYLLLTFSFVVVSCGDGNTFYIAQMTSFKRKEAGCAL